MQSFQTFHEELKTSQPEDQPSRRKFSDHRHFDLYIWYLDSSFDVISGFQLCYRENPFDTDSEFFVSKYPNESSIEFSKSSYNPTLSCSSKTIEETSESIPENLKPKFMELAFSLPDEIQTFLHGKF